MKLFVSFLIITMTFLFFSGCANTTPSVSYVVVNKPKPTTKPKEEIIDMFKNKLHLENENKSYHGIVSLGYNFYKDKK